MKYKLEFFFKNKYAVLALAAILLVAAQLLNRYRLNTSSINRVATQAERYISLNEKDFYRFFKDTLLLQNLVNNTGTSQELQRVADKPYGMYLYKYAGDAASELKFWSKNNAVPSDRLLAFDDGAYFEDLSNGQYVALKKTFTVNKEKAVAIALVPIRSDFFIETTYLPKQFYFGNNLEKYVRVSQEMTDYPVRSAQGNVLFYLEKKSFFQAGGYFILPLILQLIGIVLLFFLLHFWVELIARRKGAWYAVAIITVTLLFLRLATYLFPVILNVKEFELFDSSVYGFDIIHRSLGDLLINAVLFAWIVLFAWRVLTLKGNTVVHFSPTLRWVSGALALCILILATFSFAVLIRSLIAHSKISFDVTDFFSLNSYTIYGFLVIALLALSYYFLTQILFRIILPLFKDGLFYLFIAIAAAGLLYLTLLNNSHTVLFYIPALAWLLLYTAIVIWQQAILDKLKFSTPSLLIWIFVFSVSISCILFFENKKAEWERRKVFAEKLAVQSDPSSVRLLNIALAYIDEDFLRKNINRLTDRVEGRGLRDSILNISYTGYLNKYDTRLYVFDSLMKGVNIDSESLYDELNTLVKVQAVPTQVPDIYYAETSDGKFVYITKKELYGEGGGLLGSIFILSTPKKFGSDALTPELFSFYEPNGLENSLVYSYGIYMNRVLVSPISRYSFQVVIQERDIPKVEFEKRTKGESVELWHKASADRIIVIARKKETFTESVTLFSYIFCSFLFLTLVLRLVVFVFQLFTRRFSIKSFLQFKIRAQIYNTVIFVSIFSFIVIGVSTISFFVNRYNKLNTDRLVRTTKTMIGDIQKQVSGITGINDNVVLYNPIVGTRIKALVKDISVNHGMDINVYDVNGNLFASSEENAYSRGVLSKKMEPLAYHSLSNRKLMQFNQKEKIGNLSYWSIYSPLRDENRNVYAYLNVPYFTSQPELNKEISDFLVTIINLNAFIFLIAGLIAFLITNRITRSFAVIRDKMKQVNLGKENEAIVVSSSDEIGELVKEYNKMVEKLGESAVALAKSEREGAWREMARQVAHEIKNPLTPMKLSIQYLQKAIHNNQENVKQLSAGVAATLVEQIDHLAKIAEDFSHFANIGNRVVSVFDLRELIQSLVNLYASNEKVFFEWQIQNEPLEIQSDKTQINRLFTNLILNAIQACEHKEKCIIRIEENISLHYVTIGITDNGDGIRPEVQQKIFEPNFTTKSSGTGLGLAMCKGIVEQAKGDIWFETKMGIGATFFVKLPLGVG